VRAVHSKRYKYMLARLRDARHRAGLTQVQVAKALGRTQAFVSKCELGERRIDPLDLQEFAHLYRRDFSFFLPPPR
jgi:transcriptional regulator with XRE-family HTH domain